MLVQVTPRSIRQFVRDLVKPVSGSPEVDPQLVDDLLFHCMSEWAMFVRPVQLRKTYTASLVAGTNTYVLPSDLLMPLRVRTSDSGGTWGSLTKMTPEELDDGVATQNWEDTDGVTYGAYYESGVHTTNDSDYGKREITITPDVEVSVTNGLVVRYLRKPYKVADMPSETAEVIDIPDAYHVPLCFGIAWYLAQRQSTSKIAMALAKEWRRVYDDGRDRYRAQQHEANQPDYDPTAHVTQISNWEML